MEVTKVPWIEIPVTNFNRAVTFYSNALGFLFTHHNFEGRRHAISQVNAMLSISLVERREIIFHGSGPVIFFKIETGIGLVLEKIEKAGGKIIQDKTLIRNKTSMGESVIAKTMIDHQSGYYALFSDSENHLLALYANS